MEVRHTQRLGEQSLLPERSESEKTQLGLSVQLKEATVEDGCGLAPGRPTPLPKPRRTPLPVANNAAFLSQLFYGLDTLAFSSSAQATPESTDTIPSSFPFSPP